jgi:hypothetical protein
MNTINAEEMLTAAYSFIAGVGSIVAGHLATGERPSEMSQHSKT